MNGLNNLIRTFFDLDEMVNVFPTLITVGLRNTLVLAAFAMLFAVIAGLLLSLLLVSRNIAIRARLLVCGHLPRASGDPDHLPGRSGIADRRHRALRPLTLSLRGGRHRHHPGGIPWRDLPIRHPKSRPEPNARCPVRRHDPSPGDVADHRPQAVRNVLPATMNQFIIIVKETSLVYLLGLFPMQRELFSIAQDHAANTGNLSALVAAGIIYCVITVPLTHLVNHVDKRLRDGPKLLAAEPAEA